MAIVVGCIVAHDVCVGCLLLVCHITTVVIGGVGYCIHVIMLLFDVCVSALYIGMSFSTPGVLTACALLHGLDRLRRERLLARTDLCGMLLSMLICCVMCDLLGSRICFCRILFLWSVVGSAFCSLLIAFHVFSQVSHIDSSASYSTLSRPALCVRFP